MKIVLSPHGVYAARVVGIVLAMMCLGHFQALSVVPLLGLVLGPLFFWADFRVRSESGEGATLDPLAALWGRRLWFGLAVNAGAYLLLVGLFRVRGQATFSPFEWIAGMTMIGIANDGLRAYGFRTLHRLDPSH